MTAKKTPSPEGRFAALLAAWDDARAGGPAAAPEPPPELRPRLERGLACVSLLRAALRPVAADPGATLGRFRIVRELGRGAFGVVFLARDPRLGREVALKVPRPEALATPELRDRFLREARAAAGLDHPNLVPVFEADEAGPVCYIASAYCPGPTLADWLSRLPDPVPPRAAALLVAALADGIHHAHGRGVVHRDLKPSNVLLGEPAPGAPFPDLHPYTAAKVVDFGLAKVLDARDAGQTASGAVLGTPAYMAPEQAGGRGKEVGPAADVYALGAILYECLTGRPPFRGETALETLRRVVEDEPEPPRRSRPQCPRDLETICLKCLEKAPARRYADAAALAADLRRFLAGAPVLARRTGTIERAAKWARRRPAWAALVAVSVAAAAALIAGVLWHEAVLRWDRDNAITLGGIAAHREAEAKDLTATVGAQRDLLKKKERADRQQLYDAHMNLAWQAWEARRMGRLLDLLEGQRPREGDDDLRGFEWYYLWRLSHGARVSWPGWPGVPPGQSAPTIPTALSPDGRIAALADGNDIRLWDVPTGRERAVLRGHGAKVQCLAMAADGRTLASGAADGTARLWDLATGEGRAAFDPRPSGITRIALSPNGDRLAASGAKDGVAVWDTTSGRLTVLGTASPGAEVLAFAPDGKTLAAVFNDKHDVVSVFDIDSGDVRAVLKGHADAVADVVFSPDGRLVATRSDDRSAKVWAVDGGKELGAWLEPPGTVMTCMAFSPDGGTVALGEGIPFDFLLSGKVRLWEPATRSERKVWDVPRGGAWSLAYSPDGKRLAVGENGGAVRIHDVSSGQLLTTLYGHRGRVTHLAFGPGGLSLTSASPYDPCVKIWDPTPWPEPAGRTGHTGPVAAVAFAPDGRSWVTAGEDGAVVLRIAGSGAEMRRLLSPGSAASAVALSPGGAVAVGGTGGTLTYILESVSGGARWKWGGLGAVRALRFSPDGRRLLSAGGGKAGGASAEVVLWDASAGGKKLRHWDVDADNVWSVDWSRDGRRLAWGAQGRLTVWDLDEDREVLTVKAEEGFMAVAFSPDGKTLAAGTWRGPVRLWDLAAGSELPALEGHADAVRAVAFSPDGKTLATGGKDAGVKLWNVAAGQELLTLPEQEGKHVADVRSLAFSPDGRTLAAGLGDGVVEWWDASDDDGPAAVDEAWLRSVADLPAAEQPDAVARMLRRYNRHFDGGVKPEIKDGVVTGLELSADGVTDLTPIRALTGLRELKCTGSGPGTGKLGDLSPLRGLPLAWLDCSRTQVADLSPLKGMPLTTLHCWGTHVSDLSPLRGVPLRTLWCGDDPIADFSPLEGMPLTDLRCPYTRLSDLSALKGLPLEVVDVGGTSVSDLSPLRGKPLRHFHCYDTPVADLSPLRGAPLRSVAIGDTKVSDLSPLRGAPLETIFCYRIPISDLSPLKGAPLEYLAAGDTKIADLTPLRGMPLHLLYCYGTPVTDLSPLTGMPLEEIACDVRLPDALKVLRSMPSLKTINATPAARFWQSVEAPR